MLVYLGVSARVSDDQQAWLPELLSDLVSECAWCEPACNRGCSCVLGELEHCALAVWAGRDGNHIL
jgi:hypothetical protein